MSSPPLILIGGPTACRKTELSVHLARHLGGEVICGDSVQLLAGFEIGSASPTASERGDVPHHLFGSWSPLTPPDAGAWVREADRIIAEVRERGHRPIVVGGTGLYLKALRDGLAEIPAIPAEVRERLAQEHSAAGIEPLWRRLRAVDPEAARNIQGGPRNTQRVLRALEVFEGTGKRLSVYHAEAMTEGGREAGAPRHETTLLVPDFAQPILVQRLWRRVAAMLDAGFEAEVAGLLAQGVPPKGRALGTLGYRELSDWLMAHPGQSAPLGVREAIAAGHRAYAKRQRTWFRAMGGHSLDASSSSFLDDALSRVS